MVQRLRLCISNAGVQSLVRNKIQHATGHGQKLFKKLKQFFQYFFKTSLIFILYFTKLLVLDGLDILKNQTIDPSS